MTSGQLEDSEELEQEVERKAVVRKKTVASDLFPVASKSQKEVQVEVRSWD